MASAAPSLATQQPKATAWIVGGGKVTHWPPKYTMWDYPPFDRLPRLSCVMRDGAASFFERDFLVTTVLEFSMTAAPHDGGEPHVCAFEYALALGRRAAPCVLSNVAIIERALWAGRHEKNHAFGKAERPLTKYSKPKPLPEVKFEMGLSHVQAWSQFERTGTIDVDQLVQPKITDYSPQSTRTNVWSPHMSALMPWDYYSNLPREVQEIIDVQVKALPHGWDCDEADEIIQRHWSETRRDPARGAVLAQLEKSLYLHDAIDVSRGYNWDPHETAVAVSVGGVDGRVIFLVSTASYPGNWSESMRSFGVRAVWCQKVADVARTRCVELLFYAFGGGFGSEDDDGSVCVADRASCDAVAAALGIPSDQIGTALRAVVLAADVRGHGCLHWEALEVFHAGRCLHGGFWDDPEETYRREDGPFENPVRTWHGSRQDHSLVRLRGFAAVDAFPNIARATTHDGFERSSTFEHELDFHASPYRALKFAQEFAMALRPADFAGLIPLINAFRVTIEYKKPPYWRGDSGYFPLTTAGVLWREQARRKSRGWNNCGVFGPDGPDY